MEIKQIANFIPKKEGFKSFLFFEIKVAEKIIVYVINSRTDELLDDALKSSLEIVESNVEKVKNNTVIIITDENDEDTREKLLKEIKEVRKMMR